MKNYFIYFKIAAKWVIQVQLSCICTTISRYIMMLFRGLLAHVTYPHLSTLPSGDKAAEKWKCILTSSWESFIFAFLNCCQIFKTLFEEGLEIQKQRLRDLRVYAQEKRDEQRREHQIELESLENYYKDQVKLHLDQADHIFPLRSFS